MIKFEVDRDLKTFQLLEVLTGLTKLEIGIYFKKPKCGIEYIRLEVQEDLVNFICSYIKSGQITAKFPIDEMVSLDLVFDDMLTVIESSCFLTNIITLCFLPAKPRVTFKVKSFKEDSWSILKLDYDETANLNIERHPYHFKLTDLGLEITNLSSIYETTNIIMKDPNLIPLSGVLNHKIVTEPSALKRFINMLNTTQNDVIFEIDAVAD